MAVGIGVPLADFLQDDLALGLDVVDPQKRPAHHIGENLQCFGPNPLGNVGTKGGVGRTGFGVAATAVPHQSRFGVPVTAGKRLRAARRDMLEPVIDSVPTGLFIEDGIVQNPLNLDDGNGNFYLKPNGVFFVRPNGSAAVMESGRLKTSGERPRNATQSGPLLLAGGKIHPVFEEDSTSRLLRNGVGIDSKGRVVFACSFRKPNDAGRINLWGFAALFRDKLDCRDALYLDGDVSTIYIRGETHDEVPVSNFFGPILGITEKIENAKPSP